MLVALEGELITTEKTASNSDAINCSHVREQFLFSTWKNIANAWECFDIVEFLDQSGSRHANISGPCTAALASNQYVLSISKLKSEEVLRRLSASWDVKVALAISGDHFSLQGNGSHVAPLPLIKLSPQLMHVENLSLSSVARSARAVGAGDLRDALQPIPIQSKYEHVFTKRDYDPSAKEQEPIDKITVTDSPGAVQELFARIGLGISKEDGPHKGP